MKFPVDFQANILKPHGRNFAAYLMIRFKNQSDNDPDWQNNIRAWLSKLAKDEYITSHKQQCQDTKQFKQDSDYQAFVVSIAISNTGFSRMGIDAPLSIKDGPFLNGMNRPQRILKLHDYDRKAIEQLYRIADTQHIGIDAVLSIAHNDLETLQEEVKRVKGESAFQKAVYHCFEEYGFLKKSKNAGELAIGPLGFSDGHSNAGDFKDAWEIAAVKEETADNQPEPSYGSFLAFRKMEVNMGYFEYLQQSLVKKIRESEHYQPDPNLDEKKEMERVQGFAAAQMAGRYNNGLPLILDSKPRAYKEWIDQGKAGKIPKDPAFNYGGKNDLRCPVHAHLRAINPRKKNKSSAPIIRRSLNFCSPEEYKKNNFKENNTIINVDIKGILFVSYQKSLSENFEPLFDNIRNHKDALAYRQRETDPIPQRDFSVNWGEPHKISQNIDGTELTSFKGGQYFYAPSLTFLTNLKKPPLA